MKKILFFIVLALFVGVGQAQSYQVQSGDYLAKIGQKFGMTWQELWNLNPEIENPNLIYVGQEINTGEDVSDVLGATLPVAGQTYYIAGSGVTAAATSITLQSLTIPQTGYELLDADFSDTFYITLEPGNTKKQEIVSCTTVVQNANNTATVSGCSRGLLPYSPFTASSSYAFAHGGGTQVIFSDPPQLFNEYPAKANTSTITGQWTFNALPYAVTSTPTDDRHLITLYQFQQATSTGGVNSSETVKGVGELSTGAEAALGTSLGDSGARLVIPNSLATSTGGTSGNWIPVTSSTGKLNQSFLNLTESYSWTGAHTFIGTTTLANLTIGDTVIPLTSGGTLTGATTPQPVYIVTSTGRADLVDGNVTTTLNFIGFAITSATAGQAVYVQANGLVDGFTGLTTGSLYYASDTAGSLSTATGTSAVLVGRAVSSTAVLMLKGKDEYIGRVSGSTSATTTVSIPVNATKAVVTMVFDQTAITEAGQFRAEGMIFGNGKSNMDVGTSVGTTDSGVGDQGVRGTADWQTDSVLITTVTTNTSISYVVYFYR